MLRTMSIVTVAMFGAMAAPASAAVVYDLFDPSWTIYDVDLNTGRGVYFTADTSLSLSGIEVYGNFAAGYSYSVSLHEGIGQDSDGIGSSVAGVTFLGTGNGTDRWTPITLSALLEEAQDYTLNISRTDGTNSLEDIPIHLEHRNLTIDKTTDDVDFDVVQVRAGRSGPDGSAYNNYTPLFRLVVPEPTSAALLLMMAGGHVLARRRRPVNL